MRERLLFPFLILLPAIAARRGFGNAPSLLSPGRHRLPLLIPRGGSETGEATPPPQVLYLPGLLDATVAKPNSVSCVDC